MHVKTNITDYRLHKDAICKDFDLCGVSFEKIEELYTALSQLYTNYGILSTFVEKREGRYYFYYLGEKGDAHFTKFRNDLQKLGLSSLLAAPVRIQSDSFEDEYILLQLLFGYLGANNRKNDKPTYGNYLGRLYASQIPYTKDSKKNMADLKVHGDTIVFNRITYSRDKTIYVNVETWMPFVKRLNTKQKTMKRPYRFVMEWKNFRDGLIKVSWAKVKQEVAFWAQNPENTERFKHWYVKGTYLPSSKNSMPYFTFEPKNFLDDKLKIYIDFMDRVNKELGKYVTLIPTEMDFDTFPITKNINLTNVEKAYESDIRAVILKHGITIIASTKEQIEKGKIIRLSLIKTYNLPQSLVRLVSDPNSSTCINPSTWNIQIVNRKESYVDKNGNYDTKRDEYNKDYLQHITAENIESNCKTLVTVCMTELLLKYGFMHKKMPSWMTPSRNITVVSIRQLVDTNGNDKRRKSDQYEFFALSIDNTGKITKKLHFSTDEFSDDILAEEIEDKFLDLAASTSYKTLKTLEGLIRFDDGEFCGIYRTTRRPVPDYKELITVFKKQKQQGNIPLQEAIQIMTDLSSDLQAKNEKAVVVCNCMIEEMNDLALINEVIDVNVWFNMIRKLDKEHKTRVTNVLDTFLTKHYPNRFVLQTHIKKESENPYEIDRLTGIQYREKNKDIEYYVGLRKISSFGKVKTYRTGFPIRIIEKDSSFTFDEYASMLDVFWVRRGTKEPTVLPYPFKMLREYIKWEDSKHRASSEKQ